MSQILNLKESEKELLKVGYSAMSPFDRNQLISEARGQLKKEFNEVTEQDLLDHHRKIKLMVLNAKCEEEILKGFVSTNGNYYRTNRDDQINMIGQKDAIATLGLDEVFWKTENKGYIIHTSSEWLTDVYGEAFKHKQQKLMKYDALRTKVAEATSHNGLLAIQWDEI